MWANTFNYEHARSLTKWWWNNIIDLEIFRAINFTPLLRFLQTLQSEEMKFYGSQFHWENKFEFFFSSAPTFLVEPLSAAHALYVKVERYAKIYIKTLNIHVPQRGRCPRAHTHTHPRQWHCIKIYSTNFWLVLLFFLLRCAECFCVSTNDIQTRPNRVSSPHYQPRSWEIESIHPNRPTSTTHRRCLLLCVRECPSKKSFLPHTNFRYFEIHSVWVRSVYQLSVSS